MLMTLPSDISVKLKKPQLLSAVPAAFEAREGEEV